MSSVVDFHSHILPHVDDGSSSLNESVSMLRLEAEQGVSCVVATPHFYAQHDTPEQFLHRRNEAYLRIQEVLETAPELPSVYLGAEVYFFRGISHSDAISQLTIDNGKCILIEMPSVSWTESMYRELENIYTYHGLTPILAHIDRYVRPFHARKVLQRLAELPVLVQANAEFFLNKGTAAMAMRMLRAEQIHLLGSDCHNLEDRKPNLGEAVRAIEKRLGTDAVQRLSGYEQLVLSGKNM